MISPLVRQSFLLSSRTVFIFSILREWEIGGVRGTRDYWGQIFIHIMEVNAQINASRHENRSNKNRSHRVKKGKFIISEKNT
jgi:hypothetical protein